MNIDPNTPVIVLGYCGLVREITTNECSPNYLGRTPMLYDFTYDIELQDVRDPRITIKMEGVRADEIDPRF